MGALAINTADELPIDYFLPVKVFESQEKQFVSLSDTSEKKIQGLANDVCNIMVNLDTNQHIMLNLQNSVDEIRKQRRKELKDHALRRAQPLYTKIDAVPSTNIALPANYPIYTGSEKQPRNKEDELDLKNLKKRVETLEAENSLMKATLQNVLEKIGSFTELQINAFVRSEKQARKDVNKLKKVLFHFLSNCALLQSVTMAILKIREMCTIQCTYILLSSNPYTRLDAIYTKSQN